MSKRAEERALEAYPGADDVAFYYETEPGVFSPVTTYGLEKRCFVQGYEQAEKDLGWHSVDESLPPIDEEVIVLADRLNLGALFAISFGHIVDRMHCSDYNGWNIPGVKYWMPMPKMEEEKWK